MDGTSTASTAVVDRGALEAYLRARNILSGSSSVSHIAKFSHGQSNPTYLVQFANAATDAIVLRKKPPPPILPSAHAIEREFRVLSALHSVGFPVPRPVDLCEDPSVLGTPFYLMQFVRGRIHENPALEDVSQSDRRRQVYLEMARLLARLHSIDPAAVGLADYGKRGDQYVARQVETWNKQFERSASSPEIQRAMRALCQRLRDYSAAGGSAAADGAGRDGHRRQTVTIAHGDFRLDNIIFSDDGARAPVVLALLDWELSTLGDPLADVAYSCLPYYIPRNCLPALALPKPLPPGVPTVDEYVDAYCTTRRIRRPSTADWNFYVALGLFRLASILVGVAARVRAGNASSANAKDLASDRNVLALADIGLRLMQAGPDVAGSGDGPDDIVEQVRAFVREHVLPVEDGLNAHARSDRRWTIPSLLEELKSKAKARGLWNLWISPELAGKLAVESDVMMGRGLSNLEYARAAEVMGYSKWAPEAFNCSAPDTGNMEVLLRYGTPEQQRRYLLPLLRGETRSCFAMTEPRVASSDATNIESSIVLQSDGSYVLKGSKWWISGACDPRCAFAIFMGKTRYDGPVHKQQSMVIVPMPDPGVKDVRPLTVFGYDDAPEGHAEMTFDNVRVPGDHMILGQGRGFEIAQGRLGPGRIHHCMRLVGMGQRALDLLLERIRERSTFGKRFDEHQSILEDVAACRIDLDTARLAVGA